MHSLSPNQGQENLNAFTFTQSGAGKVLKRLGGNTDWLILTKTLHGIEWFNFPMLFENSSRGETNHRHTVRRYFQHAHSMPLVDVGKRDAYLLVHGDLPRQHPFGTTLRFTGPVPADSRQ